MGLTVIDGDVDGLGILLRHLPKGVFDDAGGIAADAELEKEQGLVQVGAEEVLIAGVGSVPAFVFDKGVIGAEIHAHGRAADGTAGDERSGDAPILLLGDHLADGGFIVIGLWTAGDGALPQAVIALGVKEPLAVKAASLEAVIDIGGDDKMIFAR